MASPSLFALVQLIFQIAHRNVLALHCYQCDSELQPSCSSSNVDALNQYLIDCANLATSTECVKTFSGAPDKIARGCFSSPSATPEMGCRTADGITVCVCNSDHCNAANPQGPHKLSPLLLTLLFLGLR